MATEEKKEKERLEQSDEVKTDPPASKCVDFASEEFNPRRALKAVSLRPPFPDVRPFNNLAEYEVAMRRGARPRQVPAEGKTQVTSAQAREKQKEDGITGRTSSAGKSEKPPVFAGDSEQTSTYGKTVDKFRRRRLTITSLKGQGICMHFALRKICFQNVRRMDFFSFSVFCVTYFCPNTRGSAQENLPQSILHV